MDAGRARVAQKSGTMVTVEGYGALCPPCLSLQLATRVDGDYDPERTLEVCQRAQKVIDCWQGSAHAHRRPPDASPTPVPLFAT